jgi:endonuclease/exonuclease/phosphatase family metal-dependent hydrolase
LRAQEPTIGTAWHLLSLVYHCRSRRKFRLPLWSVTPADTYWDYTQLRFPRRGGMRIDFVLGSPAPAGRVTGARIDREERKGKGASDHAPVIVDLADPPRSASIKER